jgi:hypothetical protein
MGAARESRYGTRRVAIVALGLALVASACAPSDDTSQSALTTTTGSATATTDAASPTTTTEPEPTTTTEPEPTEYPPGVVWEQSLLSGQGERTVTAAEFTPAGWLVTTYRGELPREPSIHISKNGTAWTQVDLPTTGNGTRVTDVVHGPAGYVAVGFAGTGCNPSCVNGNGVVWTSPDAEAWTLVEPPALTGPNKVVPNEIRVIDGRYTIVGHDEQDGIDQVFKVWSSTDGHTWELTAVLDDQEWAMHVYRGFTEWDGGYVITGSRAICRDPTYNAQAGGWGYFITGRESKAWASPDGLEWEEMDLAQLGLIEPQDDETCDINVWATDEAIAAGNGTFEGIGGRLFWNSGTGSISELELATGTWGPTTRTVPSAIAAADATVGTVEDDLGFVSVGLTGLDADQVAVATARSDDLEAWDDWSSETTSLEPLGESSLEIRPSFIATNGPEILIVFQSQLASADRLGRVSAAFSAVAPIADE